MSLKKLVSVVFCMMFFCFFTVFNAAWGGQCHNVHRPAISFVSFSSLDLEQQPPEPISVQGKLKMPVRHKTKKRAGRQKTKLPAVVILHGSAGVDFRGDFYARALNKAGFATLEIDMWEARGIKTPEDRPSLPIFNYPDAFGALRFLSEQPGIDPDRIGVIGFSWGGVISLASATELYASQFGGDLRFAAHVAHYPVCFACNSPIPGTEFSDLTGAPILIQIGEEDDYDNGSGPCFALKESLAPADQDLVTVIAYDGAYHAWDRLEVPFSAVDPFANLGNGGEVEMIPDSDTAYKSRQNVVKFFRRNLK